MGKNTKIEWTGTELSDGTIVPGHTFNPWIGCAKVSDGCTHCYAEDMMDTRLSRVEWGVDGTRTKTSTKYWQQPRRWNREAQDTGVRRKVFCGSLCDIFEDRKEFFPWRAALYELIKETPHLDWLLLTKRPGQIRRLALEFAAGWPDNVMLGTSVENQALADWRIPRLLDNKAKRYFLSLEPLLGPVDLSGFGCEACQGAGVKNVPTYVGSDTVAQQPCRRCHGSGAGFDWVIVGGESGADARVYDVEWYLDIEDQCWNAAVKCFHKQLGSRPIYKGRAIDPDLYIPEGKNDKVETWPAEWRLREYP